MTGGDDTLDFLAEDDAPPSPKEGSKAGEKWQILIVDDEHDIHTVTSFALNNYIYQGKRLDFLSAYNEYEAQTILRANKEISLVILDVVMTTPDAGLNLVKFIRDELDNQQIQIILRTGQPGDIPEEQMVKRYSVNDYKLKTELTREKLFSAVTLALRSYQQVRELADVNRQLSVANTQLASFNAQLQRLVDERTSELVQKSLSLEETLHEKSNLLRIIAHDLRNYLAIAKWSSDLATRCDPADYGKLLAKVSWAIDKQSELIGKVASLEALRSGKQTIACQAEPLEEILQQAEQTFEQNLAEKNVALVITWHCPRNLYVWVDAVIFSNSVINNIVSNAIKFSSSGDHITIDIHATSESEARIHIKDQGIGIPSEVLAVLFGFNVQTSRTGTKGERGTGFGMPIAKLLLEKMNGRIEVSSKVKKPGSADHGTEVALHVPLIRVS